MKKKWFGLTSVLLIVMLLVVACGPTSEPPADGGAVQEPTSDVGVIEETPAEGEATAEMPEEGGAAAGECPIAVEDGASITFSAGATRPSSRSIATRSLASRKSVPV